MTKMTTSIPSFFSAAAAASSSSKPPKPKLKAPPSTKTAPPTCKPVRAILRVRPLDSKKELDKDCLHFDETDRAVVQLEDRGTWYKYKLDDCLQPDATQEDVFEHVRPMLDGAMRGFSATVLAYGTTGSGKTYTMEGKDNPGVVYQSARYLFDQLQVAQSRGVIAEVHLLMFELYKDAIKDLLAVVEPPGSVRVAGTGTAKESDASNGARGSGFGLLEKVRSKLVEGTSGDYRKVKAIAVAVYDDFVTHYRRGLASRATGATKLNEKSSRSHLFVQLVIVSCASLAVGDITYAKVNLVDLAGSEKNKETGNTGERMEESKAINSSLLELKNVVKALNRARPGHVPYGNSKLTTVLKDGLGGNAQALIIANAGPSARFAEGTKRTLEFATLGIKIPGAPVANMVQTRALPPPMAPATPESRKRRAPAAAANDASGRSPKRLRTDAPPATTAVTQAQIDQGVDAAMGKHMGKLGQLVVQAVKSAHKLAPAPVHTPGTARTLALENLDTARQRVRNGNLKMACAYFVGVLADQSLDPAIRKVCERELAACKVEMASADESAAASVGETPRRKSRKSANKRKRGRVVDDSDDDDDVQHMATHPAAAAADPLTPTSKVLANARRTLAGFNARQTAKAHTSSALARPPMSYTLSDSDDYDDAPIPAPKPVPNSPTASKSSSGRAKRAKTSAPSPDFAMSPQALTYFLSLVNCGDPDKIVASFTGIGNGKAKLIVDHAKLHGGIRAPSDVKGIAGFGDKTVLSMVKSARATVGDVVEGESAGVAAGAVEVEQSVPLSVAVGTSVVAAVPVAMEQSVVVPVAVGTGVGGSSVGVGVGVEMVGKENVGGERPRKREAKVGREGGKPAPVVVYLDD